MADEIRKMALNSAGAVQDITKILGMIYNETLGMVSVIQEAASLGETQASATEEIASSMGQLTASVTNVEKVAEIL